MHVNIVLIGKKVSITNDICSLTNLINSLGINSVLFYEYQYGIDGIKFELLEIENYTLNNEGF